MLNVTQIPALRVPFIDPNTNLISREWYRFLLNLFTLTGSGNNQITLDDIQVGPPAGQPQNLVELALIQAFGLTPPVQPISSPDYFSNIALTPLAQPVGNFGIDPPIIQTMVDTSGAGTVTSVNATVPSFLNVAGVPITTSGTIAIDYSGTALPVANGGTGSTSTTFVNLATNVTGILPVANGGTGSSSLAGAGIVTLSGTQTITGQKSFTSYTNQFLGLTYATSDGGSGSNAYFGENGAYATIGGVSGVVLASGATFPGTGRYVGDSVSWRPFVDATYSCGTGSQRWSSMHTVNLAVSGTVTSGTWNGTVIGTAYGGTGSTSTTFVNLATNVTGTLPAANGGTGASSLTGAGIVTTTDTQTISGQKSFTSYTSQFRGITYATTDGASASNAYLGEDSAYAVVGGANGVVLASGASYPGTARYVGDTVSWRPFADASYSLGTGPQRWTAVYAVNGTIQTSDRTEKQQIAELDAAELAVARRIKGLIRKFKFNDSVAEKGDGARIHVGVIAQDVHDAFVAEGLDPYKYGLFCSDTWNTLDGNSQTRLGVRYEELLAFVIAAL
jgi:hypothetical protein